MKVFRDQWLLLRSHHLLLTAKDFLVNFGQLTTSSARRRPFLHSDQENMSCAWPTTRKGEVMVQVKVVSVDIRTNALPLMLKRVITD